jgi:hypothetical protein
VTTAKKLIRKAIRLVKFSSMLELPFKPPAAGDPEHLGPSCAKWAFLVLVLAYSPPAPVLNSMHLRKIQAVNLGIWIVLQRPNSPPLGILKERMSG